MNAQTSIGNAKISGADINVPATSHGGQAELASTRPPIRAIYTPAEMDEFFDGLRFLMNRFGPKPNKNDLVLALITACIKAGRNTRGEIIGSLCHLERNRGHVAITLKRGTGDNPEGYHWRRDEYDRYSLHPELSQIRAAGVVVPALKS
jgi:hypothetical protein